jgi:antitoxin (DNA-binding transcriptional repressor) of toxin-antitoxin stability system
VKRAKIAEVKTNLSRYLGYVKAGGAVMVLAR